MIASLLGDMMKEYRGVCQGLGIKIISDIFHCIGKYKSLRIEFKMWVR